MDKFLISFFTFVCFQLQTGLSQQQQQSSSSMNCSNEEVKQPFPENEYVIFGDNKLEYGLNQFRTISNTLTVKIRACKDAHILLAPTLIVNLTNGIDIVFGSTGNRYIRIRNYPSLSSIVPKDIPGLMRCDEFREFKVDWTNSSVDVKLTDKQDNEQPNRVSLNAVNSLSTRSLVSLSGYEMGYQKNMEEFRFKDSQVGSIRVKTPGIETYKRFRRTLNDIKGILFKVNSSGDAMIAFQIPGDEDPDFKKPAYELKIGSRSTTLCKRNNCSLLTVDTTNVLESGTFRPFWISWDNGSFCFGTGSTFHENIRLVYTDNELIGKFSVMAVHSLTPSEWEFGNDSLTVAEPPSPSFYCFRECWNGWFLNQATRSCRQCGLQISNCIACKPSDSSDMPECTKCQKGWFKTDRGKCLERCPQGYGYISDTDRNECACAFGFCCGPFLFHLCFLIAPCLLGVILVGLCLVAVHRFGPLKIINKNSLDIKEVSSILDEMPLEVIETLYETKILGRKEMNQYHP